MEDCIFCKIAKSEIPAYKVYEDENFFAFLDIRPLNKGHVLVIPRGHYRWVWDVPNIGEYYEVVKKIANAQKKVLKTEMIASAVVGEEVPHAHVWLIPRHEGDGHGSSIKFGNIKEVSESEMEKVAGEIEEELKNN